MFSPYSTAMGVPSQAVIIQQSNNEMVTLVVVYHKETENPSKVEMLLSLWKGSGYAFFRLVTIK